MVAATPIVSGSRKKEEAHNMAICWRSGEGKKEIRAMSSKKVVLDISRDVPSVLWAK